MLLVVVQLARNAMNADGQALSYWLCCLFEGTSVRV